MAQDLSTSLPSAVPPPATGEAASGVANVKLTEPAAAKIKDLMAQEEGRQVYLRLGVTGGGCSGMRYQMYFDDQVNEGDLTVTQHGVSMVVDPKSYLFVAGIELDFSDGLHGEGFHFKNPNATRSCGCGSSFSV